MAKQNFTDLYFGLASAEAEVAGDEEKFFTTYYDRWGIAKRLEKQDFFLIVGPKGAGKTAISEFVRLSLERGIGPESVLSRTLNLDEVSPGTSALTALTQKMVSENSVATTDAAWRLFLALRFFELMIHDQGSSLNKDPQALKLAKELTEAGLAESDFPSVLRKVRENKIAFNIKGFFTGERGSKSTDEVSVSSLGEALLRLVLGAQSENKYMLAVDGLDRIIADNKAYWLTLAALLRVGDRMHMRLRGASSNVRLLVMCRSDVFRRIRFADSDKIAGDSALFVDWAAQQSLPTDSPLWDYLSSKSGVGADELLKMFPEFVSVGLRGSDKSRHIPVAEYLLQSTRSTPREMTMLMRRIQEEVPRGGYLTSSRVREGVDNFSSRDLLTTVSAEATGMLHEALIDNLEDVLSGLAFSQNLQFDDVREAVVNAELSGDLTSGLCEFLFMAGLLGNFDPRTGYVQFYHRRDTYKFKRRGPWTLHRGLMYAFNIPYTRGAEPRR